MFEGKPPRPDVFRPLDDEQGDGERLRSLSWGDLVARLSAVRELRAALRHPGEGLEGSFDAGSARRIAEHHNGKQAVNLEDSGNGKGAERTGNRVGPGSGLGVPAGAARK